MDIGNGRIYKAITTEQMETGRFIQMDLPPTRTQMKRKPPRVGRNDLCPCGSGKKFKHCHLRSQQCDKPS